MSDITIKEVANHYSSMLDSANLINAGKPIDTTDNDWEDVKFRNREHLKLMLTKDFWTNEDFELVNLAINL